jgi:hypothetical protein
MNRRGFLKAMMAAPVAGLAALGVLSKPNARRGVTTEAVEDIAKATGRDMRLVWFNEYAGGRYHKRVQLASSKSVRSGDLLCWNEDGTVRKC